MNDGVSIVCVVIRTIDSICVWYMIWCLYSCLAAIRPQLNAHFCGVFWRLHGNYNIWRVTAIGVVTVHMSDLGLAYLHALIVVVCGRIYTYVGRVWRVCVCVMSIPSKPFSATSIFPQPQKSPSPLIRLYFFVLIFCNFRFSESTSNCQLCDAIRNYLLPFHVFTLTEFSLVCFR